MTIIKAIPLMVLFLLLSVLSFFKYKKKIFAIFLLIVSLSLGLSFLNPHFNPSSGEYTGIVIQAKSNYVLLLSNFEKIYLSCKGNKYEVGDILFLNGNLNEISFVTLESEFDFQNYLNLAGVTRELNATQVSYIFETFLKIKSFKNNFLNSFNSNAYALIDSFLFNVKDYNNDLIKNFQNINLLHIFSISGLYLNLIYKIIYSAFNWKLKEKTSFFLSLGLMSFYLVFAFNKVSVRRFTYLLLAKNINKLFLKNKFNSIEINSAIGSCMLIFNRHLIYNSSFYIGFLISFVLYFSKFILERGNRVWKKIKTFLIIYFLLLPYVINTNYQIHIFGPVFQILFFPLNFVFLLISILSFYTTIPFTIVLNPFANFYKTLTDYVGKIDVSIYCNEINIFLIILYYLLFFGALIIFDLKLNKIGKIYSGTLIFIGLILLTPFENLYEQSVSFLNIGQGDSCLIRLCDKTILIDTGGLSYKDVATSCTIPYLRKRKIYTIDYVIATHQDNDHIGAYESLKENFRIKKLVTNRAFFPLKINDIVFENLNTEFYDNENDSSLVIKSKIKGKTFLWMGDASTIVEEDLLKKYPDLSADILKVGHHGSKTSTCEEFIQKLKPKEAVISVGKGNYYGHPNVEVLNILKKYDVVIRRTDLEGTVNYFL